jgi:predicted transport protein
MADFFISYAHDDSSFVNKSLIPQLKQAGFTAWIDAEQLRAGKDWRQAIDKAIRSSLALVVVMSPKAKKSEYVTYEWAYALGVGIEVIPLLLGKVNLHPRLEALQYLDFTDPWNPPYDNLIGQLTPFAKPITVGNQQNQSKATKTRTLGTPIKHQLHPKLTQEIEDLLIDVEEFIVSLGDDVHLEGRRDYVACKRRENFASIILQAKNMLIIVKLNPDDVNLEPGFTRDIRKIGHFGTGNVEIRLQSKADLEKAKLLIAKSYELN